MKSNSNGLKEQVLSAWSMESYYVRELGKLSGSGDWRTARCPFHDDDKPSFGVNVQHGGWRCHASCGQGDLFDFYARRNGLDARADFREVLHRMAAEVGVDRASSTANATSASTQSWSAGFVDVADFLKEEATPGVPYVIEQVVPWKTITIVGGWPKSMKSWLGLDMALTVTTGVPFLGQFGLGGPVSRAAIVQEEDPDGEVQKRLWWLARGRGCDPRDLSGDLHVASQRRFRLDDRQCVDDLVRWVEDAEPHLLVLDPLRRMHAQKENDATALQPVIEALRRLAEHTAVVVVAHTRKHADREGSPPPGHLLRGSGDLWAVARSVLGVRRSKDLITVEADGNFCTLTEPIRVRFVVDERGDGTKQARFVPEGGAAEEDGLKVQILKVLTETGGLSKTALRKRIGGAHDRVDGALDDLAKSGIVMTATKKVNDRNGRPRTQDVWVAALGDANEALCKEQGNDVDDADVPF